MYFALKRRGVPARMIQYADQAPGISGYWNNVHRMLSELQWWETGAEDSAASSHWRCVVFAPPMTPEKATKQLLHQT